MSTTYYQILDVAQDADEDTIKKSYRNLAKKYHPDRNTGPGKAEAEVKFKEASEAYEVLSDSAKRRKYDAGLRGPDIFARPQYNAGQYPIDGAGIQINLQVTLEEVFFGAKKTVSYEREVNCETCHSSGLKDGAKRSTCDQCKGSGRITTVGANFRQVYTCGGCRGRGSHISNTDRCQACSGKGRSIRQENVEVEVPRGINTNEYRVMRSMGHAGMHGGGFGDVAFVFLVKDHEKYQRFGNDLACEIPISSINLIVGCSIDVDTFTDTKRIVVAPNTPAGRVIRLPQEGLLNIRTGERGHLMVRLVATTPTDVSEAQMELLKQFVELDKLKQEKEHDGKAIPEQIS